ncbi:MAG TPA: hypothetical protein VMT46_12800 [Anaerolineaceae bacterium]|nr:hypothetical protein [Anaerolineaceae bacterium]
MMNIEQILDDTARLISQAAPSSAELRKTMIELDDLIHSSVFQELPAEVRTRLQAAYRELSAQLRNLENPGLVNNGGTPGFETSLGRPERPVQSAPAPAQEHNLYAEQQMEEAEKMFYGGRYAEAIKIYDQILQIEPKWERARQHREESESYLRTGYIPSVALPAEAATAFGKAQSAARLGRYQDAMLLLSRAQTILREMGIQRWQEGQEFEQKLQQNIDAESVYNEGLALFADGKLEEGIDKVEIGARATGLPKYNDKAQEMRKVKTTLQTIGETLNSPVLDPQTLAQTKTELDGMLLQYNNNPAIMKLKTHLETVVPKMVGPLKEQIRTLRAQAERAQTLDAAQSKARQARIMIDQVRNLGYHDEEMDQIQAEVDKLIRDTQRYQDDLQQAMVVYNTNRSWPAAAARMSQAVRARYPNDSGVIELNRMFSGYQSTIVGIKAGGIIIGIILIGLLVWMAGNRVGAYLHSLTPTATPTATATGTALPTATPIPSTTPSPRPTATASLTPTPLIGKLAREVFARNGCYETFTALGKIPAGATVRFLPQDRRFDNLNRECVLVSYDSSGSNSVIGWILIADLAR